MQSRCACKNGRPLFVLHVLGMHVLSHHDSLRECFCFIYSLKRRRRCFPVCSLCIFFWFITTTGLPETSFVFFCAFRVQPCSITPSVHVPYTHSINSLSYPPTFMRLFFSQDWSVHVHVPCTHFIVMQLFFLCVVAPFLNQDQRMRVIDRLLADTRSSFIGTSAKSRGARELAANALRTFFECFDSDLSSVCCCNSIA